jgi:DNA-binding response OmpR family regulator
MKLLLIEDDIDSAEAMAALLRTEGIEVEWAASAGQALALFEADRTRRIDVLMLDLMLPDMDGRALVSRLAAIAPLPAIIVHSAATRETAQEAGRAVGAFAVLRKPTDWRRMREILGQCAGARATHGH